jgi:hypothetical protein
MPHAVVAIGAWVAWDPADERKPGDRLPEVEDGFLLLAHLPSLRQHRLERLGELVERGRVTIGADQ